MVPLAQAVHVSFRKPRNFGRVLWDLVNRFTIHPPFSVIYRSSSSFIDGKLGVRLFPLFLVPVRQCPPLTRVGWLAAVPVIVVWCRGLAVHSLRSLQCFLFFSFSL